MAVYKVTITMKDGGVMSGELYPDIAPIDPEGTGMGGPGYTIKGEFASNGVQNDLKHTRGVLSMARTMDPDSAGSQFFIMHQDAPHLDGEYAAFGKITEGLDVLDRIASVKTNWSDQPWEEQVIESIRVE